MGKVRKTEAADPCVPNFSEALSLENQHCREAICMLCLSLLGICSKQHTRIYVSWYRSIWSDYLSVHCLNVSGN